MVPVCLSHKRYGWQDLDGGQWIHGFRFSRVGEEALLRFRQVVIYPVLLNLVAAGGGWTPSKSSCCLIFSSGSWTPWPYPLFAHWKQHQLWLLDTSTTQLEAWRQWRPLSVAPHAHRSHLFLHILVSLVFLTSGQFSLSNWLTLLTSSHSSERR